MGADRQQNFGFDPDSGFWSVFGGNGRTEMGSSWQVEHPHTVNIEKSKCRGAVHLYDANKPVYVARDRRGSSRMNTIAAIMDRARQELLLAAET